MADTIERLIGETLVFGIPGPQATPEDIRLFRKTHARGLILYRTNFRSPAQIRHLIRRMEETLERRLLVTTDHEGGRVVMFRSGVTVFPDNLAFGAAGKVDATRLQGGVEGRELRRLGIDVAFSPTVDVLTDAFSPNIGIRSYGRDPAMVARLATGRIRALQREGVSACAKHFPGLGPATLDPHLDLPTISVKWTEWRRRHLVPFQAAIKAGVDMIMSSHPVYPNLDPLPQTPATFSRRLMADLLRKELGYRGVVASDDLEMGALRGLAPVGRSAVLAARAGHDLLLCCHRRDLQIQVFHSLRTAYASGELSRSALELSVERIRALRGFGQPRFAPPFAERSGPRLARQIAAKAVTVRRGNVALPLSTKRVIQVIFPRLSDNAAHIMVESALCHERTFIKKRIPRKFKSRVDLVSPNPTPTEIRRTMKTARHCAVTVFFCYDAHLQPRNRELMEAMQTQNQPLVLVLLRDPYDEEFTIPSTTVVTAFGYRQAQLEACLKRIF